MGCFEMPNFANGTETVAKALSETDAVTIIGGGDSAAAVNQLGYGDKIDVYKRQCLVFDLKLGNCRHQHDRNRIGDGGRE